MNNISVSCLDYAFFAPQRLSNAAQKLALVEVFYIWQKTLTNFARIMRKTNHLDWSETLNIKFRNRLMRPGARLRIEYRGFALEHVRVPASVESDFSWLSQHHYLALHDLVMDRGELNVEGLPTVHDFDLRDKMAYFPAGQPFKGWSKTAGRQNSFTFLHFDPAILSEETGTFFNDGEIVPLIHFEDPHLLSTMKKLGSFMAGDIDQSDIYVEALALLATLELGNLQSRGLISAVRTGRLSLAQERLLRDYIEENLAHDVSLDELSRLVQLSRFHLSRRFKATFGTAPHRYIVERRLDAAKRLLKNSKLSVASVAATTGFPSVGAFIRTFKLETGLTPLVFRRT